MIFKRRPKHILAVYVESRRLEIVRAQRQWRSWQVGTAEQYHLSEGEGLYDYLQRLNLRPKSNQPTALILFLARNQYIFNREHYPTALQDRLEESLSFDWQENLFYDSEQMLHFIAPAVAGQQQLTVPIFSVPMELYEKFHQALGAAYFSSFTIIPTALAYKIFLADAGGDATNSLTTIFARVLGPSQVEIHRFLKGEVVDSFIIENRRESFRLFRESLLALNVQPENGNGANIKVQLLCTPEETLDSPGHQWVREALPVETCTIKGSLLLPWVEHLVVQEEFSAFGSELHLKPWHPPKIILPLLVVVALYAGFAAYQVHRNKQLTRTATEVQTQRKQLEAQWKPIEQLQANIAKLQEDQKALAEFDQQAYPVLELFTLLSQITPEDTWLDFLSLANREMQIRGESKSAVKYLSELSKVEGFSNVSFASPVSRNPTSDKERFNVRIQMDVEKLRKTLANKEVDSLDAALTGLPAQDLPSPGEPVKQLEPPKKASPPDRKPVVQPKVPQPAEEEEEPVDEPDEDAGSAEEAEEASP
jgi:cell division protein FtsB